MGVSDEMAVGTEEPRPAVWKLPDLIWGPIAVGLALLRRVDRAGGGAALAVPKPRPVGLSPSRDARAEIGALL